MTTIKQVYHGFFYDWTAEEYVAHQRAARPGRKLKAYTRVMEAMKFLREHLADGPKHAGDATRLARTKRIKGDALFRARRALGVVITSRGRRGSIWELPK